MDTRSRGYSVVELLVALVIGLVLLLGVMAVFATSRTSFDASEVQAQMADDARFSIGLLGEDLRMAGSWGPNSFTTAIDNRTRGTANRQPFLPNMAGDCAPGFYTDLDQVVVAFNDTNPFPATCIPPSAGWAGGDVLVVRYANPVPVANNQTAPGVVYVRSETGNSVLFTGTGNAADVPANPPNGTNHTLRMYIYYLSSFTEVAGDGLPSLHRISLQPGPTLVDELLVSGVENFQLQLGFDTARPEPDGLANTYINPDSLVINWNDTVDLARVRSVRVWLLLRSEFTQRAASAPTTVSMGGANYTPMVDSGNPFPNYKNMLVSGVFDMRNFQRQNPGS